MLLFDRCRGVVSIFRCTAYWIVFSLRTPKNFAPRRTTARVFLLRSAECTGSSMLMRMLVCRIGVV